MGADAAIHAKVGCCDDGGNSCGPREVLSSGTPDRLGVTELLLVLPRPMPRTRRARTAAKPSLLELPDELLTHVATLLLEVDLTAALRLVQVCKALSTRLATIQQAAGKRRMRWLPEFTTGHAIEDGGRTAVCEQLSGTWTASTLFPTRGRVSWTVTMTSRVNPHNETGICNADSTDAWTIDMGMFPSPRLNRKQRDQDGNRRRSTGEFRSLDQLNGDWSFEPDVAPDTEPDPRYKHREFEFTLDVDAGELWVSVHGCDPVRVFSELRAGEALRACSIVHGERGDRVVLSPYYRVQ